MANTDTAPTIEVKDSTTVYTKVDGSVTFRLTTGVQQTIILEPDNTVIERPGLGVVTIIQSRS